MLDITQLLRIAELYGSAVEAEEKTVSYRVFCDSKKLSALRAGRDINVSRFNAAMQWFSDHWPSEAIWPDEILRPMPSKIPEVAE